MKELLIESEKFLNIPVLTRAHYREQLMHFSQTKEVLIVT